MKNELKILGIWLLMLVLLRLFLFFPHRDFEPITLMNMGLQLLLCELSILILWHSKGNHKYIYLNFALFFMFSIPMFLSSFVEKFLFPDVPDAGFYYHVYVNKLGMNFSLIFTILYVVTDYVFARLSVIKKYLVSILISAGVFVLLYSSFLADPMQMYHQNDYVSFKALQKSYKELVQRENREPSDEELAQEMLISNNGKHRATKTLSEAIAIAHDLRPYLKQDGSVAIFWKPLELRSMYLNGLALFIVLLFFTYYYRHDRPYSPYVDKIMILLFVMILSDIILNFGSVYSYSLDGYHIVFKISQYFTILCLLIMVYAFDLRLRFVVSVTGKYYEQVLQTSPERVTRWKDELDLVILKLFFAPDKLTGRLGHFTTTHQNQQKGEDLR